MARFACNTAIFTILIAILTGTGAAATAVPADDPGILYTGRWDQSDPSQPWAYAQGSSIIARFEGSSIAATLGAKQTDYLRVIVDDDAAGSEQDSGRVRHGDLCCWRPACSMAVHKIEIVKETDHRPLDLPRVRTGRRQDAGRSPGPAAAQDRVLRRLQSGRIFPGE